MKRYIALVSLLVGAALGFSIVSQSFMSSPDDATFGDLALTPLEWSSEFPGYMPLSLTTSNLYGTYRLSPSSVNTSVLVSNVSSYVNSISLLPVDQPCNMGFSYAVPINAPASTHVTVSVSTSAESFKRTSNAMDVSSFQYSVYGGISPNISADSASYFLHSAIGLLDSDGKFILPAFQYTFGTIFLYDFVLSSDVDTLFICFYSTYHSSSTGMEVFYYYDVSQFDVSVELSYLPGILSQLTDTGNYVRRISVNSDVIVEYLKDLSIVSGTPSEMQKFEDAYLQQQSNQLSQVESMMGSQNTALPNGGDFAGFVSDVQDGLGLSGSSFSASDFSSATSKFGDSSATGAGGPWEFFSGSVRDSLSGDSSSIGLFDDDYIYVWFDEMQRRYGLWNSSSP